MTGLSGMTGFARISGEASWGTWAWEAKSVNGRGLDLRVNLPPGFEALDRPMKVAAGARFSRGSLQIGLRIDAQAELSGITLNEAMLDALAQAHRARTGRSSVRPIELAILMTARGIVDAGSTDVRALGADQETIGTLLVSGNQALDELTNARLGEGQTLAGILGELIDDMAGLTREARVLAATQPELVKTRLDKQLSDLGLTGKVDADRLGAEAALAAARADVREELDRLDAHYASARGLLAAGGPAGRKLDFLSQELNREANTLCSKSVSMELTNAGLALKALVDQFKEQAANVE